MKLLRRFLAPLLALCFALAPAGAATLGQKAAILNGVQGWSYAGSSIDLFFSLNGGSCTVNRILKPCSSLLTTTRASTGYAQWADGHLSSFAANVPRITDLGLLVEQAATNLALQSAFGGAAGTPWSLFGTTITTNAATAPDNTVTAALIKEDSSVAFHRIGTTTNIATAASTAYTLSLYAKTGPGSKRWLWINPNFSGGGSVSVTVDLTDGTTSGASGSPTVVTQVRGGFVFIAVTFTTSVGTTSTDLRIGLNNAVGAAASYTGDGTSGNYVSSAQLELGSFPTSYIPTTTVSVARATDVIRYPKNPLGAGNFTMFASVGGVAVQTGKFPAIVVVNDGSGLNQTQIYSNSGGPTANGKEATGGVSRFDTSILSSISGGAGKIAMTLNGTAARGASNGGNLTALGTWTSSSAFTQMEIGTSDGSASNALNGYVKRLAIFQTGFSDGQLNAVTQ